MVDRDVTAACTLVQHAAVCATMADGGTSDVGYASRLVEVVLLYAQSQGRLAGAVDAGLRAFMQGTRKPSSRGLVSHARAFREYARPQKKLSADGMLQTALDRSPISERSLSSRYLKA
jgi:hypothetical protein